MAADLIAFPYPETTAPIFDGLARALAHAESLRLALTGLEPEASAAALHGVLHHLSEELRGVERAAMVIWPTAGSSNHG